MYRFDAITLGRFFQRNTLRLQPLIDYIQHFTAYICFGVGNNDSVNIIRWFWNGDEFTQIYYQKCVGRGRHGLVSNPFQDVRTRDWRRFGRCFGFRFVWVGLLLLPTVRSQLSIRQCMPNVWRVCLYAFVCGCMNTRSWRLSVLSIKIRLARLTGKSRIWVASKICWIIGGRSTEWLCLCRYGNLLCIRIDFFIVVHFRRIV